MQMFVMLPQKLYQSGVITDHALLKRVGISAILNVDHYPDDSPLCAALPHYWRPFDDGECPSDDDLTRSTDWGVKQILDGQTLLVHCAAGMNRSSLMTGIILHKLYRVGYLTSPTFSTGEGIVDFIRRRRPGALMNYSFETYLRELSHDEGDSHDS